MKYWIPHGLNHHWQGLIPVAQSLAYNHGGEVCLKAEMPTEACVVIGRHLLARMPAHGSILVNTEYNIDYPVDPQWEEWDILDENEDKYGQIVRMGWYPINEYRNDIVKCDVLFAGCLNDRRLAILKALTEKGVHVVHASGTYGNELHPYIYGAKIILDVHYHWPKAKFNPLRVTPNMIRGKAVVSESAGGYYGERLKDGYIAAEYDKIVDECLILLGDDKMREELETRAKEVAGEL